MTPSPAQTRYEKLCAAGRCHRCGGVLSTKTMCDPCAAGYRSRRLRIKTESRGSLKDTREKWAAVDWSLPLKEIAKQMNCDTSLARYHWKKREAKA